MEKSREQFERWALSKGFSTYQESRYNSYNCEHTRSAWVGWQARDETITDLCTALDNVLSHTSTDTISEAVAVLERVRGETK